MYIVLKENLLLEAFVNIPALSERSLWHDIAETGVTITPAV